MNLITTAIQCLRSNVILATAFLLPLGQYLVPIDTAHVQAQEPIMKIFFVEVQGGSSSLVILPNGKTLLIDGGTRSTGGPIIVKLLQEQNITKVDAIVGTHLHRDHFGGLIPVIENFTVGEILDPGIKATGNRQDEYFSAINSSNAQYKVVRDGDEIILDPSVKIEVMHPPKSLAVGIDATHESRAFLNNFSIVIKLSYGEFDILFPGDILGGIQEGILDKDIDVEVMLAPHHGSPNAQNLEFLTAASPELVIIIPGEEADEVPTKDTLDLLKFAGVQEVVNTRAEGTTVLVTDGHMYEIESLGTGRTFVIPEFNSIQIIFIIGILIPILIIQYRRKLWTRNNKSSSFPI